MQARRSILRRKAQAVRRRGRAARVPAAKALRRVLGRAARDELQLPLTVTDLRAERVSLAELLDLPQPQALLTIVEGPAEALGLVGLAPPVLSAVIEMQTIGRVLDTVPQSRKPTVTDAAMSAPLIDRILVEFAAALSEGEDAGWSRGYRFASPLEDARPLGLVLEDCSYRVFVATLDLGAPARAGELLIALPAEPRAAPRRHGQHRGAADAAWSAMMEKAVLSAPARVEAVLHRASLPLADVMALAPGSVLPVPASALEQVALEGPGGRPVAHGRLGLRMGCRAVRLQEAGEAGAAPRRAPGSHDESSPAEPALADAPAPQLAAGVPAPAEPCDGGTASADPAPQDDLPDLPDLEMADLPDLAGQESPFSTEDEGAG